MRRSASSPRAPRTLEHRRDRLSVWVAEHRWAVPLIRLVTGLGLVLIVALVFRTDVPWDKLVALVVGIVLGDRLGEREKQRGDDLRADSLPAEFAEYADRPRPAESDGRYIRPGHM